MSAEAASPDQGGLGLPASGRPPKEDLFRAIFPGGSLRTDETGGRARMVGHFCVFNEWAEIDSVYEGHFLERVAPGAAKKTIAENRANMKVLFHHGLDQLGVQVLGSIDELREDEHGAYYEVGLFSGVPPLVMDGLRAGEYGASYRFAVVAEDFDQRPARSAHNPRGIPERTIREMKVREFGPTPFPAFAGASSGIRSLTDEVRQEQFARRHGISVPDVPWASAGTSTSASATSNVTITEAARSDAVRVERAEYRYQRCADYVGESVWAMHPAALATILQILGERQAGHKPTPEEIRERIGTRDQAEPPPVEPSVAVINVFGSIFPKANLMTEMSGATSIEAFRSEFRKAVASQDVKAILLNIDSPGGSASQVPEIAAEIFDARGTKPIVAQANGWAASAAYWIACAADEIVITPSGEVGSIGVWSAHDDISAMQEMMGVKTTLISAGQYKVEGNPYEPLSTEAAAEMQRKVDATYEMFVAAVAKGRGVSAKTVKDDFGQGRMLLPAEAVSAGMADRVASLDQTLARLAKTPAVQRSEAPAAQEAGPEPSEATPRRPTPEPSEATTPGRTSHLKRKEEPSWRL